MEGKGSEGNCGHAGKGVGPVVLTRQAEGRKDCKVHESGEREGLREGPYK